MKISQPLADIGKHLRRQAAQPLLDKPLDKWRQTARTNPKAFYPLVMALTRTCLTDADIMEILREEALYARSPTVLRTEIRNTLAYVRRNQAQAK